MYSFYEYISYSGAELFTAIALPERDGKYPVIITRTPYVDDLQELPEDEVMARFCSFLYTIFSNL